MPVYRADDNLLYYLIYGNEILWQDWTSVWLQSGFHNTHLTVRPRPTVPVREAGFIDMTIEDDFSIIDITTKEYEYQDLDGRNTLVAVNGDTYSDIRTADRLTLDNQGFGEIVPYVLALKDVEYVDAPLYQDTHLRLITKDGFTTDGSLKSIWADVGHHEFVFTSAKTDSTLFTGEGHDDVRLSDNLDLPGEQYWTLVRRETGELDAYDLVTGYRVRMSDGYKAMGAESSSLTNYGEVERVYLKDYRQDVISVYSPGERLNYEEQDARGNFRNIDLRSDGELDSDSFNLAYFNFIRYTTDNVWVGEATIHDGTTAYLVGDQQVAGAVSYDLIGTSRNGTHDLIISEQSAGVAGNLRIYSKNVDSGAYNTFNDVYVGDSSYDAVSYANNGSDWAERVALYGFGGDDVLKAGAGYDYIFGGQSTYDQVLGKSTVDPADGPFFGNLVTGEAGADYFGVGHTNTSGVVVDTSTTKAITTIVDPGNGVLETNITTFHKGYGTDAIMDWHAGTDTLVVLKNGVAVIAGLYGEEISDSNTPNIIDLRAISAVATSDQDGDGARGGVYASWDSDTSKTLDYIYENQQTRDAQSIFNEQDKSVINEGLIVARGLDGDDLIYASAGADYLYGNSGVNTIILDGTASSEGASSPLLTLNPGADRVYYDTRAGKQYVANFQTGVDKFYLAKNVIDAFDPDHKLTKSWSVVDGTASYEYTLPQAYDQNITFIHDFSFKPLLSALYGPGPYTNMQYAQADFIADSIDTAAGSAMYSVGSALWSIPFVGPALAIPFYVLGGIFQTSQIMSFDWDPLSLIGLGGIVPDPTDYVPDGGDDQLVGEQTFLGSNTHLNATYKLTSVSSYTNLFTTNYVYVIKSQNLSWTGDQGGNSTLANDSSTGADNPDFLDFFDTVSDGFIPALELNPGVDNFADAQSLSFDFDSFTNYVERNASDYGVYAYFAVHSNNETFVYLVNSRDNLITNDEAFLVAEIGGILTADDFNVYNGGDDIYNQYQDHPEPGVEPTPTPEDEVVIKYIPTITSVDEQLADDSWSALSEGERTSENTLRINVAIDPTASSAVVIKVYDSMEIVNDLPLLVGQDTVANGTSTVTINDSRALGQTIIRTDFDIDYGTIDTSGEPPSSIAISDDPASGTGDLQALSEDNSFEYFDAKVTYYAVAESNISGGFTVKESSDPFSVVANGPSDDTIYGGAGTDTLFLSATSQHLNTATDAQITGIERITVKTGLPPVLVANKSMVVDGLNIDYEISSVTIADAGNDLAAGYYELTFTDDDAEVETPATGWFAKVDGTGRVIAVVTNASGRSDYDAAAPSTPSFSKGLFYDSVSITSPWEMIGVEIDLSNQGESGRAYDFYDSVTLAGYDLGAGIITSGTPVLDLLDGGVGGALDYIEAAGFEITGGSGADTITAAVGDDTITGFGGANSLSGGSGNDLFRYYGAVELLDDTVAGGEGTSDTITITYNDDDGDDVLDTTLTVTDDHFAHVSTVEVLELSVNQIETSVTLASNAQSAGIKTVYGADNDDTSLSGSRADSIDASAYTTAITIVGGVGNDTIHAGSGVDSLNGGDGDDVFLIDGSADHGSSETISAGSGTDTIRFVSTLGDTLILSNWVTDTDNLIYVEISDASGNNSGTSANSVNADGLGENLDVHLTGNEGDNVLTGNGDGNNTIIAGGGDDSLVGGAQSDALTAGDGNDTILGGGGIDSINAGAGNDVLVFASASELSADATVIGGSETDTIRVDAGGAALTLADSDFANVIQVEKLDLTGTGAQAVTLGVQTDEAFASGITITTNATATSFNLQGSASTVSIDATGTSNADTLIGGLVDDTLDAGSGGGSVSGGGGADTILWSGVGNTTISGGAGNDFIDADAGQTGADNITGDAGDDTIYGGEGNDTILGGDGNDRLIGEEGSDVLWGGQGKDDVTASGGSKVIVVGDLSGASDEKLVTINSTLATLVGYDPELTSTNYTTSDAVSGESITFDANAGNELHLFGTVDLTGVTLTGTYNIFTYSSLTLTQLQLSAATKITLVDNASGTSSHELIITDDNGHELSADDQLVVVNAWLDKDGQQLVFGTGTTPAGLTVAGTKLSYTPKPSSPAFKQEEIQGLSVEPLPAGNPIGANPNTQTLLFDSRSDTDGVFDDPVTIDGAHFAIGSSDRFKGATFVSTFEPGITNVPVPPTFLGTGDNKVHNRQFEVYYGDYDQQRDIFTVTATPSSTTATPYTLILYDNDTSNSVAHIDALVFANFMVEPSWSISQGGTSSAKLSYQGALPSSSVIGGSGDDILSATETNKYVYALGGNDSVFGTSSADFIFAGVGTDTVIAGSGADVIDLGDATFDSLNGDERADLLVVNSTFGGISDSKVRNGISEVVEVGATTAPGDNRTGEDYIYKFERGTDIVRVVASGIKDFDHTIDTFEIHQEVNTGTVAELEQFTLIIDLDGLGIGGDDIGLTFRDFGGSGFFRDSVQYWLTGSDGNDSIIGGQLSDSIIGGGGSDTLSGGAGDDTLSGGDGDDTLIGGAGADVLIGGAGNDKFTFLAGDTDTTGSVAAMDTISGFEVGDSITLTAADSGSAAIAVDPDDSDSYLLTWKEGGVSHYAYLQDTGNTAGYAVSETSGVVTLAVVQEVTTLYADNSLAIDGNTLSVGGATGSTLNYVRANTQVVLQSSTNLILELAPKTTNGDYDVGFLQVQDAGGNTRQVVEPGLFVVRGKDTSDTLDVQAISGVNGVDNENAFYTFAFAGNDSITGWSGVDYIAGGTGNDTLIGNAGNDTLVGGDGSDSLLGGEGNDTIIGGADADLLFGEAGNDFFLFGSNAELRSDTTVVGGDGVDRLVFGSAFDIFSEAGGNFNTDVSKVSGVEEVQLYGASRINIGTEVLNAGIKTFITGTGDTEIRYDNKDLGTITVDAGALADGKTLTLTEWGFQSSGAPFVVTNLKGDLVASTIRGGIEVTASAEMGFATSIVAGLGNDTLSGGTGNDTINGGTGNDSITGGAGGDVLTGGAGADIFIYAPGESYEASGKLDVVEDFVSGTDKFQFALSGTRVDATFDGYVANHNLGVGLGDWVYDDFNGAIRINAGTNVNGDPNTYVVALTGKPSLVATDVQFVISGTNDHDVLIAGAGSDIITGGAGNDTLTGGSGADTFVFEATRALNGLDTITDFTSGVGGDVLDFAGSRTVVDVTGSGDDFDVIEYRYAKEFGGPVDLDVSGTSVYAVSDGSDGALGPGDLASVDDPLNGQIIVADGADVILIVGASAVDTSLNVYRVFDSNADNGVIGLGFEHLGVVNGSSLESLVAANIL